MKKQVCGGGGGGGGDKESAADLERCVLIAAINKTVAKIDFHLVFVADAPFCCKLFS